MPSHVQRSVILAAGLILLGAACAAPAQTTPEPDTSPPPPAVATPTPAAQPNPVEPTPDATVPSPTASPNATGGPGVVVGPGESVLDYLPESIMDEPYEVELFSFVEMLEESAEDGDELNRLLGFLAAISRGPGDVQTAVAFAIIDDEHFVQITAVHVTGVDQQALRDAMVQVAVSDIDDFEDVAPVVYESTVGGKPVTVVELEDSFDEDERAYFYTTGEIGYQVDTTPELAETVLASLP